MKVSEIDLEFVKDYLRLDLDDDDLLIESLIVAIKSYCASYIGCTVDELDKHDDITIAVLAMVAESYDVRQFSSGTGNTNTIAQAILGIHCKNFIG